MTLVSWFWCWSVSQRTAFVLWGMLFHWILCWWMSVLEAEICKCLFCTCAWKSRWVSFLTHAQKNPLRLVFRISNKFFRVFEAFISATDNRPDISSNFLIHWTPSICWTNAQNYSQTDLEWIHLFPLTQGLVSAFPPWALWTEAHIHSSHSPLVRALTCGPARRFPVRCRCQTAVRLWGSAWACWAAARHRPAAAAGWPARRRRRSWGRCCSRLGEMERRWAP